MADLTRTVEIIFGAVDNTGAGLSSISSKLDSAVAGASNITKPLSDVADYALKAEAAISVMAATLLAVSVNESAKFSAKIAEIGTLANNTAEQNDILAESVQNVARNIGSSDFDQFNQALYVATSNVGNTSTALEILAIAEKGAVVGATSLDNSAALLTRTMNAYGLVTDDSAKNTENAERVMAAMFATVQSGDTNMAALSGSLGRVAASAAGANIPIETVGAAIAALTGAGITTEESMTLLNSAIKELLNPSDKLSEALGGLKVTTDGLPAVMNALQQATGGSSDKFYDLFSSAEAAKAALILSNDSAGKFKGTLDAMPNSIDNLNQNFEIMSQNLTIQTQKMENAWTAMIQTIGKPNEDNVIEIEQSFAKIFDSIAKSVQGGAFDDIYSAIDAFSAFFVGKLNAIATNLPEALNSVDFGGLIAALQDAGAEFGQLFGNIDLTTPQGLAEAIQFVVDSFESLTRVVSGIIDAWGPAVKLFLSSVDAFNDLDDSTKKTTGQILGASQVFESFKSVLTEGTDAINSVGDALNSVANAQYAAAIAKIAESLSFKDIKFSTIAAAAGAIAAVSWAIKENVEAWDDYKDRQNSVADSTASLTANQEKITDRLNEISQRTGVAVGNMDDLNKAVEDGRLIFNDATGAYEAAGTGIRDYDSEVLSATESGTDFAAAVNEVAKSLGLTKDGAKDAADGFSTLAEAQQYIADNAHEGAAQFTEYRDGLYYITNGGFDAADSQDALAKSTKDASLAANEGSQEWKRVQDVLLESQKIANEYQIALGELANKRYEIDVQAAVDLQVAEIEADTARISAAFEATASVIDSLSVGVSDLWALFAGNTQRGAKSHALEDAAKRMEDRLDEELSIKREMADAIIEKMQAEALRLSSGEPLISIDAGNLAPELELVFDKILKYTQIRATQEGLALLVGVV